MAENSQLPVFATAEGTGTAPSAASQIRIARPSRDLAKAEQFYVDGLGLKVLYRLKPDEASKNSDEHQDDLLMLGWPGAAWHLELCRDVSTKPVLPIPTEEDLLVIYLDGPIDPATMKRLVDAGGKKVTARNPYWETWGSTVEDPDGYRLVLSQRHWENT